MKNGPYEILDVDASCQRIEDNGVRAFLVTGKKRALLIDTGYGTGNIKKIVSALTELPVTLVNTHTDPDHIGCNRLFDRAYMHPAEYDRYCQGASASGAGASGAGASLDVSPLWEGDVIDLGGRSLEVILIPGHTPGSIALLDAENRILFSGDTVQTGTVFMFGKGRNMKAYLSSLQKLAAMADRFDTVYPSHGSIPVDPAILPGLIEGAGKILRGETEGVISERFGAPVKLYDGGPAKFLY